MAAKNCVASILGTAFIVFTSVVSAGNGLVNRDSLVSAVEGIDLPQPTQYSGGNVKAGPVLDGRSLVESWLRPRQLVCDTAGWAVCPSNLGCCPSVGLCCQTDYCKAEATDVCCPDGGTCTAGYECAGICNCIETGGECCADGRYCQAGNICVVSSSGQHGCCTNLQCTAYVSNGATIPLTPTAPPNPPPTTVQPVTTPPPEPTVTLGTYYYFTITWSYYFYYYTYIVVETTSVLTSSYSTVYTTISVYGTNAAAASASFSAVSATLSYSTPAAATTALAGSTFGSGPAATTSSPLLPTTSSSSSSSSLAKASTETTAEASAASSLTSPHAGPATISPSSAGAVRLVFGATLTEMWSVAMLATIALTPGFLMVWL